MHERQPDLEGDEEAGELLEENDDGGEVLEVHIVPVRIASQIEHNFASSPAPGSTSIVLSVCTVDRSKPGVEVCSKAFWYAYVTLLSQICSLRVSLVASQCRRSQKNT